MMAAAGDARSSQQLASSHRFCGELEYSGALTAPLLGLLLRKRLSSGAKVRKDS